MVNPWALHGWTMVRLLYPGVPQSIHGGFPERSHVHELSTLIPSKARLFRSIR